MHQDAIHTNPTGHGVKLSITLTPDEDQALHLDSWTMFDQLSTVLCAMVALRTGPVDPIMAERAFGAADRIESALDGVRDALTRGWTGSHQELAEAMGIPDRRATAVTRRRAINQAPPTPAEDWATGTRRPTVAPVCQYGDGSCKQLATHDIVLNAAPMHLPMCRFHVNAKLATLLDQGEEQVGIRTLKNLTANN